MDYVIGAIVFILVLMIIVLIHEMGHFLMARRAKILCHEFSIGMGPLIWKTKKGETVYSIRCIPIGGYVAMAGEDADQDFLQNQKFVKLQFDENNNITKIICDIKNEKYGELPFYKLLSYDLTGTLDAKPDELFLKVTLATEVEVNEYIELQASKKNKKQQANLEQNQEESQTTTEIKTFIVNRDCMVQFNKKEEYQIAPKDRRMNAKGVGARFLAVVAGPVMNFVLALVLYFIIGLISGYPMENSTKVDNITKGAPVYEILSKGDEIVSINGTPVKVWDDISKVMAEVASGKTSFDGGLVIEYKDKDDKVNTAIVNPSIMIYAIEMVIDSEHVSDNQVYVGEYSQNNTKTKAYKAGLRKGDLIKSVKIKGSENSFDINEINDILVFFSNLDESCKVEITYLREDKLDTVEIETYSKDLLDSQNITLTKVQLGISPVYGFDFAKLLYRPWVQTGSSCLGIFKTLGLLFTDKSVNIDDFSGPVGIFQLVSSTVASGFIAILSLMAFLSVNIGFVNLLPLPALDGGRLAFIIYEAITKKKPSPKVENIVHSIGFMLLMALFVFISFNDVLRWVGCK